MAEGKVLVISKDSFLRYHANKDLTRQDFDVVVADNQELALNFIKGNDFDVIILSIEETVEESQMVHLINENKLDIPLIVVTDNYSINTISNMSRFGIFNFLPLSFEPKNLFLAVKQAVNFKRIKNKIKIHEERIKVLNKQIAILNKKVNDSIKSTAQLYKNLQESYMRSIKALAQAIDMRDKYTYSHSENVTKYAVAIAEEMGLSFQEVKDIRDACELHDIGKIGIEDSILTKQGSLTEEEWRKMEEHPVKGAQILQSLDLKNVAELVKQHHEHFDGSGYPDGKKGKEILLGARIISLADAYDAMTSARSYKNSHFSKQEAIEEIKRNRGKQFDPKVVDVFLKIIDRFD
jgi:putative nucleotidyltransferase with HDIG domain